MAADHHGRHERCGPSSRDRADRPARRLTLLTVGLVLYGVSTAMLVQAGLGVAPGTYCTRACRR
ncbi:hypothetical protein NKH77_02265 [Streptomyces sp. M19]